MKSFPWKSRKYPIIRDEYGRSARQQAFSLFHDRYRPSEIFKQQLIPVPITTLYRYYEDWKKQGKKLPYFTYRKFFREHPEFSEQYITMLAEYFEVPQEKIIRRMQQPWGLIDLSKGELPDKRLKRTQSEIEDRLEAALRLISLREHLYRNSPKEIKELLIRIVRLKDKTDLIISHVNGKIMIEQRQSVITVYSSVLN